MRILVVADEESSFLWDYYKPGMLKGIDLILSAGDLKAEYLTFLVTMANRPLVYIHGNHDAKYLRSPPEGCECAEDRIVSVNGLKILGLGGTQLYSNGFCSYSEQQMERRIRRLALKIRRAGGVDIVLAHSPVRGYGDEENIAHRGYEAFASLIDRYKPKYFIHGHVHKSYSTSLEREYRRGETVIINGTGRYILDIPDDAQ